jgi:hypothetical protein
MSEPELRAGVAHHLGWAVVVTAAPDHSVVDRRRIELVDDGLPSAPVHHEGGFHELHRSGPELDDAALAELVEQVRASARRVAGAQLDALVAELGAPLRSISLRDWSDDLPTDIATLRRPPYESGVDSIMYRQVLAELAVERGWHVHRYDARHVEADAAAILGATADAVLRGPRATLGPPWAKDHRTALAATVLAAAADAQP